MYFFNIKLLDLKKEGKKESIKFAKKKKKKDDTRYQTRYTCFRNYASTPCATRTTILY